MHEEADYAERGPKSTGRKQAIQKIVSKIVEGVQSNW